MIRIVEIENFGSVCDRQVIDMSVAANAPNLGDRFASSPDAPKLRLPKVVAFFGANASGKTTVLRAVSFVPHFIRDSVRYEPNQPILATGFAGAGRRGAPIRIAMTFFAEVDAGARPQAPIQFAYEVALSADARSVVRESLKYWPFQRSRLLFERNGADVVVGDDFGISAGDPVIGKVRENASLISVLSQFNHRFSMALHGVAGRVSSNVGFFGKQDGDVARATRLATYRADAGLIDALGSAIRGIDVGVSSVEVSPESDPEGLRFKHDGLDVAIPYRLESEGTKRFVNVYPQLHYALKGGGVCIVDELDADIHPVLLPELIRWFQSPERNPRATQLFVACHNVALMDYLVKEEIWFTEKSADGKTSVFRLSDIEGVRRDANIQAKYLQGVFGAVPRLA
ncbi:MAG: ATP-binding protein [Tagaea sp.]|nr:ATP-binding protein [Tagaea sp.]